MLEKVALGLASHDDMGKLLGILRYLLRRLLSPPASSSA